MIKTLNKVDTEAIYLNIIKSIRDKPTLCDVGLSSSQHRTQCEKLKTLLVRSETRQGSPCLSFLFSMILEVLVRAARQEKAIKGTQLERKK